MNCLVNQNLSKENKVKKQYLGSCKGKRATFGDLSKYGVVKNPSVDGCTTNIKPPAVIDYGSDTDFVNQWCLPTIMRNSLDQEELAISNHEESS